MQPYLRLVVDHFHMTEIHQTLNLPVGMPNPSSKSSGLLFFNPNNLGMEMKILRDQNPSRSVSMAEKQQFLGTNHMVTDYPW
mmetsp:Transcript_6803/g.10966  ORF Transcript_6803/g.10966 Transcript_6803/m.10966 type:complete len:82 (-) Transcript_6803:1566-1811(-)